MTACAICDTRIDPCGRDGTRCARCNQPCDTCGGDVMLCSHPLAEPLVAVERISPTRIAA